MSNRIEEQRRRISNKIKAKKKKKQKHKKTKKKQKEFLSGPTSHDD